MTSMNGRSARRTWAFGAAAAFFVSLAVPFLALFSAAPADAVTAGVGTNVPRYALHPVTAAPSVSVPKALAAAVGPTPHGPYTKVADECATCHRTHTGQNKNLLKSASPQSNLCFTCHDGTGANTNVKAQYTDPAVPANNATTRVIYRHDAVVTTSHRSAGLNEFGGVSNRHSECGDCHNPHQANATNSTPGATGATASGRLAGVSGVSVVNGATPGSTPTYTFLDGKTPATSITREYQLCFKCHSGFTTLDPNAGFGSSRFRLDKAVEFNPNNLSHHAVEAPGKNTTTAMGLSLSGASIYRQWTFVIGDTIRCSNCHASSTKYNQTTPPPASGDLPVHTSQVAGILLAPYRNRILKPVGEAYSAAEFKLCFMCHATAPFSGSSTATNWSKHYGHTNTRNGTNTGGSDIDNPLANGGNAICAECHFRIHSTTYKDGTQTIPGNRLVNFSPNVTGARTWAGGNSCSLICHGKSH
ncbi:MAG: cytochrome c3 family protein [Phycicoccus sp.]|nr:cytochrome c3 family protein [Phycicoccus sp.]NMM35813.1 cytochrome c3 family protein [Phycicoccus sp.]